MLLFILNKINISLFQVNKINFYLGLGRPKSNVVFMGFKDELRLWAHFMFQTIFFFLFFNVISFRRRKKLLSKKEEKSYYQKKKKKKVIMHVIGQRIDIKISSQRKK